MKNLTTEEKAKAYDAALKRAEAAIDIAADKDLVKGVATTIFPELKESEGDSEDERIRKELILHLEELRDWKVDTMVPIKVSYHYNKFIAWLEKQKENIEKEYVFRPLAGTDIITAANQAVRRANKGAHLVLAFNGAYIPVKKGCNANKIVDMYDAFIEKQQEQKPEVKLTGWVARDSEYNPYSGLGLILFNEKPGKYYDCWRGAIASQLPWESFPDLKWEDEPVEVEVTIRKK